MHALMQQLDRAEARAETLPPVILQRGTFDAQGRLCIPQPHIESALQESVAAGSEVPEADRLDYMGQQLLSRLRGERPPDFRPKISKRAGKLRESASQDSAGCSGAEQSQIALASKRKTMDFEALRKDVANAALVSGAAGIYTNAQTDRAIPSTVAMSDSSGYILHRGAEIGITDTAATGSGPSEVNLSAGMRLNTACEESFQLDEPQQDIARVHQKLREELLREEESLSLGKADEPRDIPDLVRTAAATRLALHQSTTEHKPARRKVSYELQTFREQTDMAHAFLHGQEVQQIKLQVTRRKDQSAKELSKERWRELREQRLIVAEQARIEYGPTSKEREQKRMADEHLEKLTHQNAQRDARKKFIMSFPKVLIATFVVLISTVLFQVSELPSRGQVSGGGHFILPAAPWAMQVCYAMGTVGCTIEICVLLLIRIILFVEGPLSKALNRMMPTFVYLHYLSILGLQNSFYGASIYLIDGLVARIATRIEQAKEGGDILYCIVRQVLAYVLPPLLLYNIFVARSLGLSSLRDMGSTPRTVQWHILIAISACLGASSICFIGLAVGRQSYFFDTLVKVDQVYPSNRSTFVTAGFERMANFTLPFLYDAFGGRAKYAESIDGCNYSIAVDMHLEPRDVTVASAQTNFGSFFPDGATLLSDFASTHSAAEGMINQYISQSRACGRPARSASWYATAVWNFIGNPKTFMSNLTSKAILFAAAPFYYVVVLGAVSLAMTVFFLYVSVNGLLYVEDVENFPEHLFDVKTAGLRVRLLAGEDVIINHVADMPRTDGARGKIKRTGYVNGDKVAVELVDEEVDPATKAHPVIYVHEWNLSIGAFTKTEIENFERTKEMASLKTAEAVSKHEAKGDRLRWLQYGYTIVCQLFVGFFVHALVTHPTTSKAVALSAFSVLSIGSALDQTTLNQYANLTCDTWLLCLQGTGYEADFCRECSIPMPAAYDISDFKGAHVPFLGNFFRDSTLGTVIQWIAIFAGGHLVIVFIALKCIGRPSWVLTFIGALITSIPSAIAGFSFMVFDGRYSDGSPAREAVCSDPATFFSQVAGYDRATGQNPLMLTCVVESGLQYVTEQMQSSKHSALYLGFIANQISFLLDSTFTLSTLLRTEGGEDQAAQFQLLCFMVFFVVATIIILFLSSWLHISGAGFAQYLSETTHQFIFFAEEAYKALGKQDLFAKLTIFSTDLSPLETEAAHEISRFSSGGYGSVTALVIMAFFAVFQVFGMILTLSSMRKDLELNPMILMGIQFVTRINLIFFATYILLQIIMGWNSLVPETMVAVLLTIPLTCQVVFVFFYALKSSILGFPASTVLHTRVFIVSSSSLAIILNTLPLLFLIMSIVGLSFYLNRRVMQAEAATIGVPVFMTGLAGVAISILSLWYAFQTAAYYTIQEMIFHVIEIFALRVARTPPPRRSGGSALRKETAKAITAMLAAEQATLGDARVRAAKMAKGGGAGIEAGISGAFAGAAAAATAARKADGGGGVGGEDG